MKHFNFNERPVVNNGGISLPTLLTVLFVGLKLTGYIDWSWWWVLSPIWILVSIILILLIVILIIAAIAKS